MGGTATAPSDIIVQGGSTYGGLTYEGPVDVGDEIDNAWRYTIYNIYDGDGDGEIYIEVKA